MVIKNLFTGIIILLSILLTSCQSVKNPKERNILVFEDNIKNIEDCICALNNILPKTNQLKCIYLIDNGNKLYSEFEETEVKLIGFIDSSSIYKIDTIPSIKNHNKKIFLDNVIYLNQNHISQCNLENSFPVYFYRNNIYMADMQEDLDRFIVFAENDEQIRNLLEDKFVPAATGEDYNLGYKILDKKGKLYLLARKNASIWADN